MARTREADEAIDRFLQEQEQKARRGAPDFLESGIGLATGTPFWKALSGAFDLGQIGADTVSQVGLGKIFKKLVSVAKIAAPIAAGFIPVGGGIASSLVSKALTKVPKAVGAVERAQQIVSQVQRTGKVVRTAKTALAAAKAMGRRVRPGVGKVMKVGSAAATAGAGFAGGEEIMRRVRARGKKTVPKANRQLFVTIDEASEMGGRSRRRGPGSFRSRGRRATRARAGRASGRARAPALLSETEEVRRTTRTAAPRRGPRRAPTAKQIAARKRFAQMARSGAFKRRR